MDILYFICLVYKSLLGIVYMTSFWEFLAVSIQRIAKV